MASEKILAQKQSYVADLKAKLDASQGGVEFNYGGLTVAEDSKGKFEIKTGYMDGEVLDLAGIQKLATLPNREGLLSMLLSALTGNLSGLARALDAVKTKMEGEGEVA